jgi:TorA maturation chaperone TorD
MNETEIDTLETDAENRAGLYELFARILLKEFDAETLDLFRSEEWSPVLASLEIDPPVTNPEFIEDLAIDYCKIFIGPKDFAPPFQSVWESGNMQGTVMGSINEYREIVKPLTEMSIHDHAGLQFEMMALMLRFQAENPSESFGLPVSFFRNHIAWTHRLFRKAINLSETTFYQQLLESMLQFIELETEFFAVKK